MISANSLLELDAPPAPLRATPVTAPGVNAVYDAPDPRISGSQLIAARGRSSRCTAYPFAFAAAPSSSQAFSDPGVRNESPIITITRRACLSVLQFISSIAAFNPACAAHPGCVFPSAGSG